MPPGKKPYFRIPVFNYHQGHLSINYSDNYFLLSQRHAEVPRLTQDQYDAMKVRVCLCVCVCVVVLCLSMKVRVSIIQKLSSGASAAVFAAPSICTYAFRAQHHC